jgi:hypothetical protein
LLVDPDVATPQTINLYATTLFTLTVTDLISGCEAEMPDQMSVIVTGDILAVSPSAQPDEICLGETIQLFALAGGGSGEYTYTWSSDNGFSSAEANPVIIPSEAGSFIYTCMVNDGFNSVTGSVAVNVKPQPYVNLGSSDTMVCVYDTIILDAGNPGASYQWSNGSAERQITVGSTGIGFDIKTFSVVVMSQEGCIGEDEITVVFDFGACSGVNDLVGEDFITLFPNPGSGEITLQPDRSYKRAKVDVLDPSGRILKVLEYSSEVPTNQQIRLRIENLSSGMYYVRYQADGSRPVVLKYVMIK